MISGPLLTSFGKQKWVCDIEKITENVIAENISKIGRGTSWVNEFAAGLTYY